MTETLGRRAFVAGSASLMFSSLKAAAQQPPGKIARVGLFGIMTVTDPLVARYWNALKDGLRELGYVEGKNVVFDLRSADGKAERLPAVAAELMALEFDLIVAGSTASTLAVKRATSTVPIVFATPADPVASGLVASLAHPGGNVTGCSGFTAALVGKCFELLTQILPRASRIAAMSQPGAFGERMEGDLRHEAELAARALGRRVQFVEARGAEDLDRAFVDMTRARADAFYAVPSPMFNNQRTRLVALAAKHRLPAVYAFREFVDVGGLMSYGPDYVDIFRRAARHVDKILKGANPADLPVEQPTKFDLAINVKTAKALGLAIPPALLLRADLVE